MQTLARLYYLKGSLLEKQGKRVEAVASYAKSRDIYPHPENKALEALEKYKVNFKGVNPATSGKPKTRFAVPPIISAFCCAFKSGNNSSITCTSLS